MPKTFFPLLTISCLVLGACGSDKNRDAENGDESNFRAGECGAKVAKNYNAVVNYCSNLDVDGLTREGDAVDQSPKGHPFWCLVPSSIFVGLLQALPDSMGYNAFKEGCRDTSQASCIGLLVLEDRLANVVTIPTPATLLGERGAH